MRKPLQALLGKLSRYISDDLHAFSNSGQKRYNTEYKHLEEQLKTLSCAVEQCSSTIVITDTSGKIEYVNPKFTQLTGYTSEEVKGQNPRILKTDKTSSKVYRCLWQTITSGKEWRGEFCNRKKNGELYWESVSISPVSNSEGSITHFVAVKEDITERKKTEEELTALNASLEQIKASLKEKEVFLSEVHHRIKNNLQIVSSLLDLSSMQIRNQEAIQLFTDSRNRVDSIALVHSQLYESERFDEVDMEKLIQELSESLLEIYSKEKAIALDIKSSDVYLPVKQAVPYALVLNELVTNILKHAYQEERRGTISIVIQRLSDSRTLLKVKDDGSGFPVNIDIGEVKSMGLKLVRNIVYKQLNGSIKIVRDKGTEFIMVFNNFKEEV